jgi:hypothetical protein
LKGRNITGLAFPDRRDNGKSKIWRFSAESEKIYVEKLTLISIKPVVMPMASRPD